VAGGDNFAHPKILALGKLMENLLAGKPLSKNANIVWRWKP